VGLLPKGVGGAWGGFCACFGRWLLLCCAGRWWC